jgi:hypothetical protein
MYPFKAKLVTIPQQLLRPAVGFRFVHLAFALANRLRFSVLLVHVHSEAQLLIWLQLS